MERKSLGKWKLPQPTDIKEENEWISIPRIARTIPFGYVKDENDPYILEFPISSRDRGFTQNMVGGEIVIPSLYQVTPTEEKIIKE